MQSSGVPSTPSSIVPPTGLFRNGVWHCNCVPRLPAVQFRVKKDTPNKGRSFYTCQKDRDKKNKCDFFLWTEDAHQREVGAILTNSCSETNKTPSRTAKRQRTLHESITPATQKRPWYEKTPVTGIADLNRMLTPGTPSGTTRSSTLKASSSSRDLGVPPSSFEDDDDDDIDDNELARVLDIATQQNTPSAGSKRKRPDTEDYSDFSSGEESELVALVNSSATNSQDQAKHHNAFETPTVGRTYAVEHGMATPLTGKPVRRVLFADPEATSQNRNVKQEPRAADSFTSVASMSSIPPHAPSSSFSPSPTPSSSQQGTAPNVTQEVMSLLEGQKLDAAILRNVRGALDKHVARARGLERGRDASREAIKKAEARATALQERVADLENRRKLDAEARQKTRSDLMKLYRES